MVHLPCIKFAVFCLKLCFTTFGFLFDILLILFTSNQKKTEKNSVPKTDRIINFTDILYGFEIWPFTLMEESRLRVFENRVLRSIFGPKRDGVKTEWRKLHKEELTDLYFSPGTVRVRRSIRMILEGHVARIGERKVLYRNLVEKPEGKRPLWRPRTR